MSIEQRNAQKLYNYFNIANLNLKNRDIYFFLKCNIKVRLNKIPLPEKDLEILNGHMSAFSSEMKAAKWDLGKFDSKKYDKFLNDLFSKIDFRNVDANFMFKCRDLLEISPIKNDLYKKRMDFFDKKLPKIGIDNNTGTVNQNNTNTTNNTNQINNTNNITNSYANFVNNVTNVNINNGNTFNQAKPVNPFENINATTNIMNNTTNTSVPVNPFAGMNEDSNPYTHLNDGPSPYQQNFVNNFANNNNETNKLYSNPNTGLNNNNIDPLKPIQIPEDIKTKIIKELEAIKTLIVDGKINDCRQHSIEALLYFKQIFPD